LKKGCPANKMNLGLAIYGRSFTLKNNSNSIDVGTATHGAGLGMKNKFFCIDIVCYFYDSWTVYEGKWYFSIF
jgi:GH18 family chitinase